MTDSQSMPPDALAPIQVVSLAELRRLCRAVDMRTFVTYLTKVRGAQFVCKLENARVRWDERVGLDRLGNRLADDAALIPGVVEVFTGFGAVDAAAAVSTLRGDPIRLDGFISVWGTPTPSRKAGEDLQPIDETTISSRFSQIVPVDLQRGSQDGGPVEGDVAREGTAVAADPATRFVSWQLDSHTIFVERSLAESAVRELAHVPIETIMEWDADAKNAGLLRAMLDPETLGYAPRLAFGFRTWRDHVYGRDIADQKALKGDGLETLLLKEHRVDANAQGVGKGWETATALVIKPPAMSEPGRPPKPRDTKKS